MQSGFADAAAYGTVLRWRHISVDRWRHTGVVGVCAAVLLCASRVSSGAESAVAPLSPSASATSSVRNDVAAAAAYTDATAAPADSSAIVVATQGTEPSAHLDEVIVSARRREEDAQKVPVPITAIGGAALDQAGQLRLEDLNQRLPSTNVQFGNPRQSSIAVRGLGNNPANDALESSVGVYLDNVYLGRASMANLDLIDIDQIALLRGPQGTLFGKNTTAGVLNITTLAPSFKPELTAEGSVGNDGYYQLRGAASGPLLDGSLAGRISFSRTYRDGFVDDIVDGRKLNNTSRYGMRGQLLWQATDAFSLRLIGDHQEEHSDAGASTLYSAGPNGGSKYYNAVSAAGASVVFDPDYLKTTINADQHMDVRQTGASAEANWDFGGYRLTSITAWRTWWFVPTNDGDGTNVSAIIDAGQQVDDRQLSQELRLASPGDAPLSYVVGLYYFYQDQNNLLYFKYGPAGAAIAALGYGAPSFANGYYQTPQYLRTNSGSAFGQLTWKPIDGWEFAAGLRDTREGKLTEVTRSNNAVSPAFAKTFSTYASGALKRDDNDISALLSASYQFRPDVLAYASVSRGAKSGGINPAVPNGALGTGSLYVNPEVANDAELGLKSTWLDRRLIANANLFWTQVKDYQATLLEPIGMSNVYVQVLSNIGKVRTRGVETEISALPLDDLTLRLSASFNDAIYLSYHDAPCAAEALAPTNAAQGGVSCDLTGQALVGAPKWIVNPGVEYTHHAFAGVTGTAEADYSWRSKFFGSADNSKYAQVASYGLLNVRYGLGGDWGPNHWSFTLWSNNALNKHYVTGGLAVANSLYNYTEFPGLPRTYGATVQLTL